MYFNAVPTDGKTATSVFSVPVDGSEALKLRVRNAIVGGSSENAVVITRANSILLRTVKSGKMTTIGHTRPGHTCGLAFGGGTLVQCVIVGPSDPADPNERKQRVTITDRDGRRITLPLMTADIGGFRATSDWVGFTVTTQSPTHVFPYIFDLRRHRLALLTKDPVLDTPYGEAATMLLPVFRNESHSSPLRPWRVLSLGRRR